MRGCHKETMQDYRRQHNTEMWARPGTLGVEYLDNLAEYNLRKRLQAAVMLYLEEAQIGRN